MVDHDVGVPILGVGREVAIASRLAVLGEVTTNGHDLPWPAQFSPLFNLISGPGKPTNK